MSLTLNLRNGRESMGFPNLKDKHERTPLFTPKEYLFYLKKRKRYPKFIVPRGLIICYQSGLLEHILENHRTTKLSGFCRGLYSLDETDGKVIVAGNFGIGAPAAVTILEEFIAFGIKRFISIGTAGTLQKKIKVGDLMVCEKAIRDEGTSYHYIKPSKYAYPSKKLTGEIIDALEILDQKYFAGVTWTIDAPYRETIAEIKQYQKEGVATVEMEASALFAVAEYRHVQLAAMLTVSDSLAELEWRPEFHSKKTGEGLEVLYKAALSVLLEG